MRFGILGTLQARRGDEEVDLGWPKQRALLAVLLLSANRVVSRADLTVALWGPTPPASAVNGLQKYVSALRRALGPSRVLTKPPGYMIVVEPDELDLLRFEELAEAGKWHDAVAQWRGAPCEDVELLGPWADRLQALRERRDDARGTLIDERLAAGEHEALIPELRALIHDDPLREQHWARLMRAQHRAGRTAQALATYADLRVLLAEELGIDPAPEIQRVHSMLLDEESRTAKSGKAVQSDVWTPMSQLPADPSRFVGRNKLQDDVARGITASGMPIIVLSGPPGVGKTALAIRVARRLVPTFPDGQWFVRLNGADHAPRDPGDVLASLLSAAGVTGAATPTNIDDRAAMLRAKLAGRKVLVVLDDAHDSAQVRPLLPGAPGSAVLVTSRQALGGLTALEGATRHQLDVLPAAEAVELLRQQIGATGAEASETEDSELSTLADLCGRLPLALRIAAGNLALTPGLSTRSYVKSLNDDGQLAGLVVGGELENAVRSAFDASYRSLTATAQLTFRRLSLIPGPDFSVGSAAALLGFDPVEAESSLQKLCATSLLQESRVGRYHYHDLLRVYASELCAEIDGETVVNERRCALFDYYLQAVDTVADHLYPDMDREPRSGRLAEIDGKQADAGRWIDAEWENLVAAVSLAAEVAPESSWNLADAMVGWCWHTRRFQDWSTIANEGQRAADRIGDSVARSAMRSALGLLAWARADYHVAIDHYEAALELRSESNMRVTGFWNDLSLCYRALGMLDISIHYLDKALAVSRRDGNTENEMVELGNLGGLHLYAGDLAAAEKCIRASLDLARQLNQDSHVSATLGNLGWQRLLLGRPSEAMAYFEKSIEMQRALGRAPHLQCIVGLGYSARDIGDLEAAVDHANQALSLAGEAGQRRIDADAMNLLGSVARRRGEWPKAARIHERALDQAGEIEYRRAEGLALAGLARCATATGEPGRAIALAERVVRTGRTGGLRPLEALGLLCQAQAHLACGDSAAARRLSMEAAAVYAAIGQPHHQATANRLFASASAERVTDLP